MPRLMIQSELDQIMETYGVKYVFIESGELHIKDRCEECDMPYDPAYKFWCELSWGSAVEDDEFDFAYGNFGTTVTEAMNNCLMMFCKEVKSDEFSDQAVIARRKGIYEEIRNG